MPAPIITDRLEPTKAAPMSESQSLEKAAERTLGVITTPKEYLGALQRWQAAAYNILTPFVNVSAIAAQHGLVVSLVQLSPDKEVGDVYDGSGGMPFLKPNEVALAKPGLRKIADCAGISTKTERTDPRTIQHFWEIQATATYRGPDGAIVLRQAMMEWDLRAGSDRLKGFQEKQISEARKNGLRNCETRAVNAAIRECNGLKQKYTKAELAKPFLVVRVMFLPDMSDPETRRVVTERALGGTAQLYPARALPDYIDAESSSTASDASPASVVAATRPAERATTADPNAPPTPNAVRIKNVDVSEGEKNGRKWTKWTITDTAGVQYTTFSRTHGEDAERYGRERAWVEIDVEPSEDGKYRNVSDILPAGQQPSLLPDPGNL